MASIKNQHLYRATKAEIDALKEEYDWMGRHVTRIIPPNPENLNRWELVIFAIPPKKKSRKKVEDEGRRHRGPRRGNGFNRYKEMGE